MKPCGKMQYCQFRPEYDRTCAPITECTSINIHVIIIINITIIIITFDVLLFEIAAEFQFAKSEGRHHI